MLESSGSVVFDYISSKFHKKMIPAKLCNFGCFLTAPFSSNKQIDININLMFLAHLMVLLSVSL